MLYKIEGDKNEEYIFGKMFERTDNNRRQGMKFWHWAGWHLGYWSFSYMPNWIGLDEGAEKCIEYQIIG